MSGNFHEPLPHAEVKPPSARATGLVLAAAAAIVAVIWRATPATLWIASAVSAVLLALSLVAPRLLEPLNILWFKLGLVLHRVVNPLVMFVLFALVFIPAGLILRWRQDPLRSRRARDASTYWLPRDKPAAGSSMTKQF